MSDIELFFVELLSHFGGQVAHEFAVEFGNETYAHEL
jgi:hypothetical protein